MRMLLNLLLLSGLWGMPLYARWLVLADQAMDQPLSEAVVGKWWRDEHRNRAKISCRIKMEGPTTKICETREISSENSLLYRSTLR